MATEETLTMQRGFSFTDHVAELCHDVTRRVPEMRHIEMSRVAVGWAQAKKQTAYGTYASLTPLRFEGGELMGKIGRRSYRVERVFGPDVEYLYILTFYLPRFMDLSFCDKLTTIFHELWHISPDFDGDLRRHPGRCYAHTHSQKEYDQEMAALAKQWLAASPPLAIYDFLYLDFANLYRSRGRIYGSRFPRPKMVVAA